MHSGKHNLEVKMVPRLDNKKFHHERTLFEQDWRVSMPFCSHDLAFELGKGNLFEYWFREEDFLRQKRISQLQNLSPEMAQKAYFTFPVFEHTRFEHAMIVALEVAVWACGQLALDWEDAVKLSFAAAFHDCATVALGDAVRCSFEELCEERNFSERLLLSGMAAKWEKELDIKLLSEAQKYVQGWGKFGKILDCADKIGYTILDVFFFLRYAPRSLRDFVWQHALFGDVWLDLCLAGEDVYFLDAQRLWVFLMLRALMHVYLYKNPASRRIEHIVARETKVLLAKGLVSFEELKRHDDEWLSAVLRSNGCDIRSFMTPDIIAWEYFASQEECRDFAIKLGERLVCMEQIKPFKTGLEWLVVQDDNLLPLEKALTAEQVLQLENLATQRAGWYAYFYVNN